jgi:hypothetical protein
MSDPVLDGLARALAQPMPRRRAVRLMVSGLVAASFPALRPRRAAGQGCNPNDPSYKTCPLGQCCPGDAYCCAQTRECCPAGEVCLDQPGSVQCCTAGQECVDVCCPSGTTCCKGDFNDCCYPGFQCIDGSCVECDECKGESNRVASVETASGDNLGLTDKQLCRDQEVKAKEATKVHLGDGSVVTLEAGNGWRVRQCAPDESIFDLIGDKLEMLFSGDGKFNLQTDRATTGVRGTAFTVTYNERKKRTTTKVKSGKVEVWANRSPKKKVIARKGDTVIQQGNEPPEIKN